MEYLATAGIFGGLLALFVLILAILWLMVPFLIMGTNGPHRQTCKADSRATRSAGYQDARALPVLS